MTKTSIKSLGAAALIALAAPIAAIVIAPVASATEEDEPGWSCVDDGNRICGPNNPEGKPAACYDDGGVIVALWPCHVVVNPDGSSDVYDGVVDANGLPVECRDICLGA